MELLLFAGANEKVLLVCWHANEINEDTGVAVPDVTTNANINSSQVIHLALVHLAFICPSIC
jgi:hypothetical protein